MVLASPILPPYGPAARENHEPERPRKLLLHRRELERIAARANERGLTLVPTRIYFAGPHAKVEIALARGKLRGHQRRASAEQRRAAGVVIGQGLIGSPLQPGHFQFFGSRRRGEKYKQKGSEKYRGAEGQN